MILESHEEVFIMKDDLFQDARSCVVCTLSMAKWFMPLLTPLDSEPAQLVLTGEYFALPDVNVCYSTFQKILENL